MWGFSSTIEEELRLLELSGKQKYQGPEMISADDGP